MAGKPPATCMKQGQEIPQVPCARSCYANLTGNITSWPTRLHATSAQPVKPTGEPQEVNFKRTPKHANHIPRVPAVQRNPRKTRGYQRIVMESCGPAHPNNHGSQLKAAHSPNNRRLRRWKLCCTTPTWHEEHSSRDHEHNHHETSWM